jgi:hypothetical protein
LSGREKLRWYTCPACKKRFAFTYDVEQHKLQRGHSEFDIEELRQL